MVVGARLLSVLINWIAEARRFCEIHPPGTELVHQTHITHAAELRGSLGNFYGVADEVVDCGIARPRRRRRQTLGAGYKQAVWHQGIDVSCPELIIDPDTD